MEKLQKRIEQNIALLTSKEQGIFQTNKILFDLKLCSYASTKSTLKALVSIINRRLCK